MLCFIRYKNRQYFQLLHAVRQNRKTDNGNDKIKHSRGGLASLLAVSLLLNDKLYMTSKIHVMMTSNKILHVLSVLAVWLVRIIGVVAAAFSLWFMLWLGYDAGLPM